jgi:uncharacterized protein
MSSKKKVTRRSFIGGTMAAAAAGLNAARRPVFKQENRYAKPEIQDYRKLGRTGFKVSDIGFGSGELADAALLEAILDTGVNYIDTAEGYLRGGSERIIGKVMQKRDRKKVFISTKLGVRKDATESSILDRSGKSLERLQLDYVDCLMIHAPATVEHLKNPAFHNAFARLKADGRVRFCGVSNHGSQWNEVPQKMEEVLLAAAEDGRFDVMLFVYNFLQQEQGSSILEACRDNNIGATLMKTNPVLNYMEVKDQVEEARAQGREPGEYQINLLSRLKERADAAEKFRARYGLDGYDRVREAAVRFVLHNRNVNTACLTIKNYSDLEFYVRLSGLDFGSYEEEVLTDYAAAAASLYCRHACGDCEAACPHRVPVNTIMRYHQYFAGQGREKSAMLKYARLASTDAGKCITCTSGACEHACPYGVPVQGLLGMAHQTLSLT